MPITNRLDQIERSIQSMVEGSLASIFSRGNVENQLAHQLAEAIQSNLIASVDGRMFAPNIYTIFITPEDYPMLVNRRTDLEELANTLYRAADEADIHFVTPPSIRLREDTSLPPNGTRVEASIGQRSIDETATLVTANEDANKAIDAIPEGAFLIVNGSDILPLKQTVINIGRRPDNHIVIDDPRVSRTHAQLRAVKGRYVLSDLNSTGGTFVNGKPTSQQTLKPGDVISLAGVPMIFGQDDQPGSTDKIKKQSGMQPGTTQSFPVTPNDPLA